MSRNTGPALHLEGISYHMYTVCMHTVRCYMGLNEAGGSIIYTSKVCDKELELINTFIHTYYRSSISWLFSYTQIISKQHIDR